MHDLIAIDWKELFVPSMSVAEAFLRGTGLFLAIIALFRIIPKRLIGRLALADLLVVTIVAGVARNGLIRDAYSLTDCLMVIAIVVGWSYVLNWASFHNRFVHRLLHRKPVRLVKDGVVDEQRLRRELMTEQQLCNQLRAAVGDDSPRRVAEAWMESDGKITAKLKSEARLNRFDQMEARSGVADGRPRRNRQALLLIDVVNDFDFDEADDLLRFAVPMAEKLAELAKRARDARVPVIYVNDNFGHWRSDFRATVEHCLGDDVPGREVVERLLPEPSDYFVLKPRHSGFFATTLETLLRHLDVDTLILTGIAGNICVLFTAYDAYLRGYRVVVPPDCVASNSAADTDNALAAMRKALKAQTPLSNEIDFAESEPAREAGEAAPASTAARLLADGKSNSLAVT